MNTPRTPGREEQLVGSVRRAGTYGPAYLVRDVHDSTADIEFLESEEKAKLPVSAVLEDPLKD
jgi:hypothetical protein